MKQMSLIEMDGFLKGKCIPRDLKVNETNAEYLVRKFAEAEAKCAALAVENAGIKSAIPQLRDIDADNDNMDDVSLAEDFGFNHAIERMRRQIPETPATDAFLAEVRAQGVKSLSNAVQSVIAERQRHQSVEGWTPEHDDQYSKSQLLWASSCYVLNAIHPFNRIPFGWPWTPEWWKPTNPRRDLVKAGALILAEIERIDRQEAAQ
ncbi:TPA: ead/Ea22-like family protein [Escherichia coli]|nr:ead/Ea22-like family protein [Escherichia coli]